MRRYLVLLAICGFGVSTIVIGIYISEYLKNDHKDTETEDDRKRKTSGRKRLSLSEHLLSWTPRGDHDLPKPSKRDILLSQGDTNDKIEADEVDVTEKQNKVTPPSSVSSYTSCEEELPTSGTESTNSSASSGETEDCHVIEGAVGMSTYGIFDVTSLTESDFQELLNSPIITPNPENDERMKSNSKGRSLNQDFAVVQEYDSELSPSIVDSTYQTIQGQYSAIVMPLCPNTGRIVPDEFVTGRK